MVTMVIMAMMVMAVMKVMTDGADEIDASVDIEDDDRSEEIDGICEIGFTGETGHA